MTPVSYPCPLPGGVDANELALVFDRDRSARLLIIPALFDEANRMRRMTVETMRRLDQAGIDSFLPDLPGCNESTRELPEVELEDWRMAMEAAARHFQASHVLAMRGGCLVAPERLPGWALAPTKGSGLLRAMLRARVVSAREAGREESAETLLGQGLEQGLDLSGWMLCGEMIRQLSEAMPAIRENLTPIDQDLLGGGALWLRAEPGDEPDQSDALAAVIAVGMVQ